MQVKLGTLQQSIGALIELSMHPMPPAQAVKLKKIVKAVKAELENYAEVEKTTAEKHKGVIKETVQNGRSVQYYDFGGKEALTLYMEELKPAREVEVPIPGDTWTIDDLMKISEVKPAVLEALEWLIPDSP